MVLWKANATAWPTDPKESLTVLEGVTAGGDALLLSGAISELGWFTPQEGYAIFEGASKDTVLGLIQGFFPYYSQDVREIVSWESGKEAILESARQPTSR